MAADGTDLIGRRAKWLTRRHHFLADLGALLARPQVGELKLPGQGVADIAFGDQAHLDGLLTKPQPISPLLDQDSLNVVLLQETELHQQSSNRRVLPRLGLQFKRRHLHFRAPGGGSNGGLKAL